jgi:hypothetical protein
MMNAKPPIQNLKWEWTYPLPPPKTPHALVQAVQALIEDVAFTHANRWRPYETMIYMPPFMANHPDMENAKQLFEFWMHDRKCDWVFLVVGGKNYRVKIRAERILT